MRLTSFSDYALRMLIYTAAADGRPITIEEAAHTFDVSKPHLNKVANTLTRSGYLKAIRGRSGGLILGRRPEMIRIGDIVRLTEPDFALVECFASGNQCVLTRSCKLSGMVGEAMASFQNTLDRYTLAYVAMGPQDFLGGLPTPGSISAWRGGGPPGSLEPKVN